MALDSTAAPPSRITIRGAATMMKKAIRGRFSRIKHKVKAIIGRAAPAETHAIFETPPSPPSSSDDAQSETSSLVVPPPPSSSQRLLEDSNLVANILRYGGMTELLAARMISQAFKRAIDNSAKLKQNLFLSPLPQSPAGKPVVRNRVPRSQPGSILPVFVTRIEPQLRPPNAARKLVRLNPFVFGAINPDWGIGEFSLTKKFERYVLNGDDDDGTLPCINDMYITNPPIDSVTVSMGQEAAIYRPRFRIPACRDLGSFNPNARALLDRPITRVGGLRFRDLVAGLRKQIKDAGEQEPGRCILSKCLVAFPSFVEAVQE